MIEESWLPERLLCIDLQRHRYGAFQTGNPRRKNKINSTADKKMTVIRQHDVTSDGNAKVVRCTRRVFSKSLMRGIQVGDFAPMQGTGCHKENRRIVRLKNLSKSRGPTFDHMPV